MTTFLNYKAHLENEIKNSKKSLRHFKKSLKEFDEKTMPDLYYSKDQILEDYKNLISEIKTRIRSLQNQLEESSDC